MSIEKSIISVYKNTILSISVHTDNENPVYGEGATIVSIEDLAGGPFIKMTQCHDETENGMVSFNDIEELSAVFDAAKQLLAQFTGEV